MLQSVACGLAAVLLLLVVLTFVVIAVCFKGTSERHQRQIKTILVTSPAVVIVLQVTLLVIMGACGAPVIAVARISVGAGVDLTSMAACLIAVFVTQSLSLEYATHPFMHDKVMRLFAIEIFLTVSYSSVYFAPCVFYYVLGDGLAYSVSYCIQCILDVFLTFVFAMYSKEVTGSDGRVSAWAIRVLSFYMALVILSCLVRLVVDFPIDQVVYNSVAINTCSMASCLVSLCFAIRAKQNSMLEKGVLIFAALWPMLTFAINHYMLITESYNPLIAACVLVACYVSITEKRSAKIKEHMDEVALAATIQQGMLPHSFPDDPRIEVFACMEPAKEVAGDFYDVYQYDADHIYLLVADVSGKDVPAALFMSKAKALMREYMKMGYTPHQILTRVNKALCEDNEEKQFVTAWLARFNLRLGCFTYANAGHNPPVVAHGGGVRFLENKPKLMLGMSKKVKYARSSASLQKGDRILVYTDGVTEAVNPAGEQFGDGRLLEFCETHADASCEATVKDLVAAVDGFAQTDERFDDVTLLAMSFEGDAYSDLVGFEERCFKADLDCLGDALDFVEGKCETIGFGAKDMSYISICVDEIFTNVASYAYEDGGDIAVAIVQRTSGVTIHFIDEGIPFNPLLADAPELGRRKEDAALGGVGIYMVRDFMDDVKYEYECGENRLFITKNLPGSD